MLASVNVRRLLLPLLVGIGLGLRLYLAAAFHGNYDQDSYEIVVSILRHGGNVYAETSRYNYSPLWAYSLLALSGLADLLRLPYHLVIRSFLTVISGVTALLIARLSSPRNAIIYWLNPVTILLVGFGGQFETLAALPILIAMVAPRRTWPVGTLALVIKQITLPAVWMLFALTEKPRRSVLWMAGSLVAFALTFFPFAQGSLDGIIQNVFLYRSGQGWFGLSLFLPGYHYYQALEATGAANTLSNVWLQALVRG